MAVLVRDGDERVAEVPAADLPEGAAEGAVLQVPMTRGQPDWEAAELDEELRRARRDAAERILGRLRRRDPGGDIVL